MRMLVGLGLVLTATSGCKPESNRQSEQAAEEVREHREDVERSGEDVVDALDPDRPQHVDRSLDVLDQAIELVAARTAFEQRRRLRVQGVRAEHEVLATQPALIAAMARDLPLTDAGRAEVNAKLAAFQMRLDEASNLIEGVEHATPDTYDRLDEGLRESMRRLTQARDAAWGALGDAPATGRSAT